jgi:RNA-directed DNA polymerase
MTDRPESRTGLVESRMLGDGHVRFGGRPGETGQRKRRHRASGRPYVLVVSGTRAQTETLREEVAAVLAQMGLRLSEQKTRIAHIDEGFDFLGWRIQRQQKRGAVKRVVYTYPSKAALMAVKATVRALTRGMTNHPLKVLLHQLNPVLRGWTSYYGGGQGV